MMSILTVAVRHHDNQLPVTTTGDTESVLVGTLVRPVSLGSGGTGPVQLPRPDGSGPPHIALLEFGGLVHQHSKYLIRQNHFVLGHTLEATNLLLLPLRHDTLKLLDGARIKRRIILHPPLFVDQLANGKGAVDRLPPPPHPSGDLSLLILGLRGLHSCVRLLAETLHRSAYSIRNCQCPGPGGGPLQFASGAGRPRRAGRRGTPSAGGTLGRSAACLGCGPPPATGRILPPEGAAVARCAGASRLSAPLSRSPRCSPQRLIVGHRSHQCSALQR
mmetsp:Transcript_3789/g.9223  ORF Transcript_3789/g.9223 Transcript_3789/m.9223 type:complete len:275 (+) Transcript_3789:289-1113(+)